MNSRYEKEEVRYAKVNMNSLNNTKSETSLFGVGALNNSGSLDPSESIRNDTTINCCCCISFNCGGAVTKTVLR